MRTRSGCHDGKIPREKAAAGHQDRSTTPGTSTAKSDKQSSGVTDCPKTTTWNQNPVIMCRWWVPLRVKNPNLEHTNLNPIANRKWLSFY
jgi:hypothetical protein